MKLSNEYIRLMAVAQLRARKDRRKFKLAVKCLLLAIKLKNLRHVQRAAYLVSLHGGVV